MLRVSLELHSAVGSMDLKKFLKICDQVKDFFRKNNCTDCTMPESQEIDMNMR